MKINNAKIKLDTIDIELSNENILEYLYNKLGLNEDVVYVDMESGDIYYSYDGETCRTYGRLSSDELKLYKIIDELRPLLKKIDKDNRSKRS